MKYLSLNIVCFLCSLNFSLYAQGDTGYQLDEGEQSGFVFDLRVANMAYKSERMIGQTSSHGEFIFIEGDTITFSLGNYQFKPVEANQYLSIFKFIESDNLTQSVSNLTRLLQAIDVQPNKTTIVLPNLAAIDLSSLNFNQTPEAFSSDPVIMNLLNTLGQHTDLSSNPNVNNHVYSMVSLFQPTK